MHLEEVAISNLLSDPSNVRTHSPQQIEKLMASLKRFGQQLPLLVRPDGTVLAGNARLEAMKRLGWQSAKIIRTDLEGVRAAEYAIADNRLHDAEVGSTFDDNALAEVLAALQAEEGFDPAAMWYSADEIAAIIAEHQGQTLPDDANGTALDDATLAGEVQTVKCIHCGQETPL